MKYIDVYVDGKFIVGSGQGQRPSISILGQMLTDTAGIYSNLGSALVDHVTHLSDTVNTDQPLSARLQ